MGKTLTILKERVRAGVDRELADEVYEHYMAGGKESVLQAVSDAMADRALKRYQGKVVAAFGRAGIAIDPEQPLTVGGLVEVINLQTGLEIQELSAESVAQAVDKLICARLSEALKVPVSTVFDGERLKADLLAAAQKAIEDGRAVALLEKGIVWAARKAATFRRRSITRTDEQDKILARARQKRFRRGHRMVWVK